MILIDLYNFSSGVREVVKVDEDTCVASGIEDILIRNNIADRDRAGFVLFSVRNKGFLNPKCSFKELNVKGGDTLIFLERGIRYV